MDSALASASVGVDLGGTFFVLRLPTLGLWWCFPGGRKGEESLAGEALGWGPSGQVVCLAWPAVSVFEGWFYIFLNCDKI